MSNLVHSPEEIEKLIRSVQCRTGCNSNKKEEKVIFKIINKLYYFEQISYNEKYGENNEIEQVLYVSRYDDVIFNVFECLNYLDSLNYQIEKEEFRKDAEKYIYPFKKLMLTRINLEEDSLIVQKGKREYPVLKKRKKIHYCAK